MQGPRRQGASPSARGAWAPSPTAAPAPTWSRSRISWRSCRGQAYPRIGPTAVPRGSGGVGVHARVPHPPLGELATAPVRVEPDDPQVAVCLRRVGSVLGPALDDGEVAGDDQRPPVELRVVRPVPTSQPPLHDLPAASPRDGVRLGAV